MSLVSRIRGTACRTGRAANGPCGHCPHPPLASRWAEISSGDLSWAAAPGGSPTPVSTEPSRRAGGQTGLVCPEPVRDLFAVAPGTMLSMASLRAVLSRPGRGSHRLSSLLLERVVECHALTVPLGWDRAAHPHTAMRHLGHGKASCPCAGEALSGPQTGAPRTGQQRFPHSVETSLNGACRRRRARTCARHAGRTTSASPRASSGRGRRRRAAPRRGVSSPRAPAAGPTGCPTPAE